MTNKLSDLFELPETEPEIETPVYLPPVISPDTLSNIEKIDAALPLVRGLESSDDDMDELAALAKNSYSDLVALGMQVESRFAAEIFNAAGTMLGHAITAKTAKLNKKLKMIDLQLRKASLDQKVLAAGEEIAAIPNGGGILLDRNELLRAQVGKKG